MWGLSLISGILSAISGILSFVLSLYVTRYEAGVNRMRVLRALFRNIKIPIKGTTEINLLYLYDKMYIVRNYVLFLYFLALGIFILPYYRDLFVPLPSLFVLIYIFLDIGVELVITRLIRIKYGQIAYETTKKSWPYFDPYFIQLTIYSMFFTAIENLDYKLYTDIISLENVIASELAAIIGLQVVQVLKRVLKASKLQSKMDFESAFFLASATRPKIKVHTNNGVLEGKVVDVRDDLVLDTGKSEVYIAWKDITYFEIIKEESQDFTSYS